MDNFRTDRRSNKRIVQVLTLVIRLTAGNTEPEFTWLFIEGVLGGVINRLTNENINCRQKF